MLGDPLSFSTYMCVVYDVYMCFYSLLKRVASESSSTDLAYASQNNAECSIFIGSASVALLPHCLPLLISPYCCTRSILQ